tara:strand:- start:462 stop:731 length:270 start_codon:yes stop_codon:yes gene_type:complete
MTNYPKSNYSKQSRSKTDNAALSITAYAGISLSTFFLVGSIFTVLDLIIWGAVGYYSYNYLNQKNSTKKALYVVLAVAVITAIIFGGLF